MAKDVPVKIENVECAEVKVKEAKKLMQNVNKLASNAVINEDQYPYLSDLFKCKEQADKFPFALPNFVEVESKIRLGDDWVALCACHFLLNEVYYEKVKHPDMHIPDDLSLHINYPLIQVSFIFQVLYYTLQYVYIINKLINTY